MSKSAASELPGVGAMTDTLEFVKNMWGGMKIPGMVMPTLSVDEINKQISDLKAVESWMTLNMNMLRGTIQALEVQSATIATLQSMGQSVSAMIKPNGSGGGRAASYATPETARSPEPRPEAWNRTAAPDGNGSTTSSFDSSSFQFAPPTADKPPAPNEESASEPQASPKEAQPQEGAGAVPFPGANAPFANPAAWWSMLQDQFKQAVDSAVIQEPASAAKKDKGDGASADKAKPASRAQSKSAASKSASGAKSRARPASGSSKPAAPARRKPAKK